MSGVREEINQVPECPPHLPFTPWWWKTQGKHFGVPSPLIKHRVSQQAAFSSTVGTATIINTRCSAARAKRRCLASHWCLLQLLGRYWAQLTSEKVFSHAVMNGQRRHIIYLRPSLPLVSAPPSPRVINGNLNGHCETTCILLMKTEGGGVGVGCGKVRQVNNALNWGGEEGATMNMDNWMAGRKWGVMGGALFE